MHDIAVMGDYESVCGFVAIGFSVFVVDSVEAARQQLKALVNGGFGIIYMTEPLMEALEPECAHYDQKAIPSIVPIPASTGLTGIGAARLKRYVEQAVGSDIVFGEPPPTAQSRG